MWIAPDMYGGAALWLSLFAYGFQIYYDFSAYTDICRGCAKLFGFELVENFDKPYLSRTPQEFWRRWHMSLSRWVRDYFYVSLGGNRIARWRTAANVLVVMAVVGLWHGAAWHFVAWGIYNGVLICVTPYVFPKSSTDGLTSRLLSIAATFFLVSLGWVFFRSVSLHASWIYFRHLFDLTNFWEGASLPAAALLVVYMLGHIRWRGHSLRSLFLNGPWIIPVSLTAVGVLAVMRDLQLTSSPFIYFQF